MALNSIVGGRILALYFANKHKLVGKAWKSTTVFLTEHFKYNNG